ncbi:MAG: NAD-dependent epimerase/dehydratase family protein [Thermomicrobiales bacterium]
MRILVTGAAGFIGSHISERLIAESHNVVGVDAFIPYYPRAIKESNLSLLDGQSRFRFVEADLRDSALTDLVADCDVVIHLAAMAGPASWEQFDQYVSCNVTGTQRLLQALRAAGDLGRRRFIQISTSSVYGTDARGNEDSPLRPASPYGITKLAAEQLAFAYHRAFGLPVIALRYFSIYGPRQRPDMAYHIFIRSLLRNEPITIFGDGEQSRGNTYIDDCVAGTLLALTRGQAGEAYNLGGGVPITLNAAIEIIEDATQTTAIRHYTHARAGDQRHTLADISKAREELGYEPRVEPPEGLRAQVDWQRSLEGRRS